MWLSCGMNQLFFILCFIGFFICLKILIKDAIKESIDNSEILEKLDEISKKMSFTFCEDSPEEKEMDISNLSYSSYSNIKSFLSSIKENLIAIKEIIKNK
jgi:hypothetical protein